MPIVNRHGTREFHPPLTAITRSLLSHSRVKKNKTANKTKKNIGSRGEETFGTPALIENVSPHPVHRTTKPTEGGRVRPLDHQWTNPWLCVWFPNGTTALVSIYRLQRYVYLEIRSLLSMWVPGFDAIAIRFGGIAHPRAIPRCK